MLKPKSRRRRIQATRMKRRALSRLSAKSPRRKKIW
jgi:hypothetical protein